MDKRLKKRLPSGLIKSNPAEVALKVHTAEAMEKIAHRTKDSKALEAAIDAKMEAQREFAAGYRAAFPHGGMREQDATSGDLPSVTYCERFGFAQRTVQRWADRLLDESRYQAEYHQRMTKVWRLIEMEQAASFSSETVEWYTPARYIEAVRRTLGDIDLDPASSELANQTVGAGQIFTSSDDALSLSWHGRVFLNPPYGRTAGGGSLAASFCNKVIDEYLRGDVIAAVILVNSLHSQSWQAPIYEYPVCLVNHRIQFVSADGQANESPTFQNLFCYLGPEPARFGEAFQTLGYVMVRLA